MKIIKKSVILLLAVILNTQVKSQTKITDNLHIKADFHYGWLLPEYNLFNYFTNDAIKGLKISLQKDLTGEKIWEMVYKYPTTGISAYYGSLGNDRVFGRVASVSPFISLPLYRKNNLSVYSKTEVGIAYVSEKFDIKNNFHNIAIGSNFNVWFSENIDLYYRINDKISLSAGTSFGHFSNANFAEPNLGLNFWTFYSGIDYYLTKKTKKITDKIPDFIQKNEFAFIIAGSGKHTRRFADRLYFAGSLSAEYKRILGYKGALGAGLDLFYDTSIPDEMRKAGIPEIQEIYKLKSGIHLSQELIIGKLSLIIQEGFYILLTDKLNNQIMYNRGIVRYKISKNLFANLAMKTNLWVLDVAELGLGYYFSK